MNKFFLGVGLEILETEPKLLRPSQHLTKPLVKRNYELCTRETRWTETVLKRLHQDLKSNKSYKIIFSLQPLLYMKS
jgi:hypothetical protein